MRLGVVGHGGRISGMIKGPFRQADSDLRVVAVVDPDEEGARSRLAEEDRDDAVFYPSLDEMVRRGNLDALAIGTRCNLHTPYAIEAAAYDIPLFLEKPVAINMEQAIALEDAFEGSACPVVVSFPLRVSPLCTITREYLADGAVGTPEHILATNYVPYGTVYWDHEYRNYDITQGLFLQKATHDLDYICYLMDSPIVRVGAMHTRGRIFGGSKPAGLRCSACDDTETCLESPESRKRNSSGGVQSDHWCLFGEDCGSPETGMNEDSSSALIEFESGVHGVYTQVFYARRDAGTRGATISGYQGTLRFDWYTNELHRVRHHRPFSDTIKAGGGASHFGGDTELARDFVAVIRGKGASRTPIRTGLESVYACLAARASAETGAFVDVRQVGAVS
ncbi:MAG: Gfo/Idh/MocA family oxidoreductase [Lentisphaerae bacterium]|jgi:predicted dehydrogenase|nr:Gfo/Idh/MocA family oxidoreductase [Lentisphaerota bacterium]MBT4820674.1 Gfo/Idh/MocA family oxidoreductase [Lentisphaerota bacterium]MBT5608550.1 Gfo/Idh/MocA family oxidoreductase [Lentisphaerota bacterium]MBT7061458.1 Gfo/Idh/MocA family oxidoreductase [Lentisphaerota bacterium]MBT7844533.1 Gfo/Idh/MocA family oxidoreductase [Lentisphaerota bacterium]